MHGVKANVGDTIASFDMGWGNQGDQPHCGFPEARYHENAERLVRAGLRVVVVEQTETPEQLRLRNEERRANGQPKVIKAWNHWLSYNRAATRICGSF